MLSEGRVGRTERPPTKPTLIYDGNCDFCDRWVRRMMRWDRRNSVRYIPLQDTRAQAVSGRSRWELEQAAHLVCPDATVLAGAAAVRELLAYLPGGWIPRAILSTPGAMPLAAKAYAWLAREYGPVS